MRTMTLSTSTERGQHRQNCLFSLRLHWKWFEDIVALVLGFSLDYDVRSTEQHSQNGDDGEQRENDETDAVDDHGGELPVQHHLVLLLFPLDPRRDVAQLADNGLQVPLSL